MQKGIPTKTCYAILKKRREQSCASKTSLVLDATGKHSLTFSSMAEASAWIRMMKTRKGPDDMTFSPVEVGSDVFSELTRLHLVVPTRCELANIPGQCGRISCWGWRTQRTRRGSRLSLIGIATDSGRCARTMLISDSQKVSPLAQNSP